MQTLYLGETQQSLFGINLSFGSQSSKSEQTQTNTQSQGSSITAGNNLNIRATDTDINVQGSQLQAGKDIGLMANRDVNQLSATNSALSTLAAGLAGGLTGDSSANAVAGAQAGKTAAENNNLAVIRTGAAACAEIPACTKAVVNIGLGALVGVGVATSAMEDLSGSQKTNVMLAAMSGDQNLIDKLTPSERAAYEEWKGNQGLITVFPVGEKDPTGGKLINPAQNESKGTSLVTPDQSGGQKGIITITPESQVGKSDGVYINPRPTQLDGSGSTYISESGKEINAGSFFDGAKYTDKVKQQASSGDYHSFPESVDSLSGQGTVTEITGGDGLQRLKLEISGTYRGSEGIFEYIRNPDGSINHRLFVPNK